MSQRPDPPDAAPLPPTPTGARSRAADPERRDTERVVFGQLPAEIMVYQPMVVREVSRTGVTAEVRVPLQIDSLHDLRLTLGDTSVVVKGRVVHSHIIDVDHSGVVYQTGLEFAEPSPPVTAAILEFLDSIRLSGHG